MDEQIVQIKVDLLEAIAGEDWRRCASKIDRLSTLDIDVDSLSATKIGKTVNKLKNVDDRNVSNKAKVLISKWKKIAGVEEKTARPSASFAPPRSSDKDSDYNDGERSDRSTYSPYPSSARSRSPNAPKIVSGTGSRKRPAPTTKTLSAAAFNQCSDDAQKRRRQQEAIETRKRGLDKSNFGAARPQGETMAYGANDHFMSFDDPVAAANDTSKRAKGFSAQQKVKPKYVAKLESLLDIAIRELVQNIDSIEEIGEVPVELMDPVFKACKQRQLEDLEYFNPHILDYTDQFWKKFCKNKLSDAKYGWRDVYLNEKQKREDQLDKAQSGVKARYMALQEAKQSKAVQQVELGRDVMRQRVGNHLRHGKAPVSSARAPTGGIVHKTGWQAQRSIGAKSQSKLQALRNRMKKRK